MHYDPRQQSMFKRSRHKNVSIFIILEDFQKLPGRTVRVNSNIYHIVKPNIFRDVQNPYQDKTVMAMTTKEYMLLLSTCWNEKQ